MQQDSQPGIIVGTAGHVDHGKTELIKAITGVDTDRLAEEKRRGLTIDLGFAPLDLPRSGRVGIVDVPGHHRFLKNMLAGVGGIDLALLVVAADEGIMPQTREHFEILQLLGVSALLVVVTKVDLVEAELVDVVTEEVREFLRETPLEDSPIVPVSSITRAGLDELVRQLDEMLAALPARETGRLPRLPVDRVFVLQGIGIVVTGSLTHGSFCQGDEVVVYPQELKARIRQIQVHNLAQRRADAGHRVALNLVGPDKEQIGRGDVVSIAGAFQPTQRLDIRLTAGGPDQVVKDWTRVRVYLGSAELLARLVILSSKEMVSGQEAICQLRLESPTVAWYGDRLILRHYSPPRLLGGGIVLDPAPAQHRRLDPLILDSLRARVGVGLGDVILAYLRHRPLTLEELSRSLGRTDGEILQAVRLLEQSGRLFLRGTYLVDREKMEGIRQQILSTLRNFHRLHPLKEGISKEELKGRIDAPGALVEDVLATLEEVQVLKEVVRRRGQEVRFTPEQEGQRQRIEAAFVEAGLSPPTRLDVLAKFDPKVFYAMVRQGTLVALTEEIYLHRSVLEQAEERIRQEMSKHGKMRLSQMKDVWGITRKFAVPLAEYLDRIGFTQRVGDQRELAGRQ